MFPSPATVRWSSSAALTGARRPSSAARERPRAEAATQRLRAEPGVEVRVDLARLQEQPRAEPAHVAVDDPGLVVQRDHGTGVRRLLAAEAAGHPEMHDERAAGVQAQHEILPAPLDGRDALAFELGGDDHGIERPRQPRVADLDALEGPSRRGSARGSRGRSRLRAAQARTSSTIGRGSGRLRRRARTRRARRSRGRGRLVVGARVDLGDRLARSTSSPRLRKQTTPTAWSIASSLRARPAPSSSAAIPTGKRAQASNVARPRRLDRLARPPRAAARPRSGRRPAR